MCGLVPSSVKSYLQEEESKVDLLKKSKIIKMERVTAFSTYHWVQLLASSSEARGINTYARGKIRQVRLEISGHVGQDRNS